MTTLPPWVNQYVNRWPKKLPENNEELMEMTLGLLAQQITRKTGGPFATIVVSLSTRELLAVGVNRVVPCNDPTAHGEMVAVRMGGAKRGNFSFDGEAKLITSAAPCGMCLTGCIWAGVNHLVYGCTAKQTEEHTGFDEGVVPENWVSELAGRNMKVTGPVMSDEVVSELKRYVAEGGFVYNGNPGGQ